MLSWIMDNLATLIISLALVAIVAGIVWSIVRRKRKGKSACGCGCTDCSMSGQCHGTK